MRIFIIGKYGDKNLLTFILNIIFVINILMILIMIFLERKEPTYIFAWTLALVFIPVLGFFLYLLFGSGPKFKRRKSFKHKKKWDALYETYLLDQQKKMEHLEGQAALYASIMRFNLNGSKSLITSRNDIKIFTTGTEKYKSLFQDIKNAKETIHILYYIFRTDEIGKPLVELLEEKAKEGVKVRILYDDLGSMHTFSYNFRKLISLGGEVYKFFPTKFNLIGSNFNYRNHRKIVVIDGVIGYTGGMNIGIEYTSKDPKLSPWRDTHIRIEGESVRMLQIRFLLDFGYAAQEYVNSKNVKEKFESFFPERDWSHLPEQFVQIVSSGPDTGGEELKNAFIKMIYTAQKSIDIQTPYFVPDASFLAAIKSAALSNVRVRLMVPKINDNHFVDRIISSYVKELLEMGVEVYYYEGFIHAKTLTIDDLITTIGTANLDVRSFKLNFEVNAFIYNQQTSQEMTTIFEEDMKHSHKITKEEEIKKKWYIRVEESVYRLLSVVM